MSDPFKAISENDFASVERYLKEGGNVDLTDSKGSTLLARAVSGHREKIALLLLDHGADSDIPLGGEGGTSLFYLSASRGNFNIFERIFEKQSDINVQTKHGDTALMGSCFGGYLRITELLLSSGANPKLQNVHGLTALHCNAGYHRAIETDDDRASICRLLLQYGAEINVRDDSGETPLIRAAGAGNLETVRILINNGADIHAVSNALSFSALSMAASRGRTDVVRYLLEQGAKLKDEGNVKVSDFIYYCRDKGYNEIVQLFKDYDTKKSGCFIATATLGREDALEVMTLRSYRDTVLLPTRTGRFFVNFYYIVSPPIAAVIARSVILRKISLVFLIKPIVRFVNKRR